MKSILLSIFLFSAFLLKGQDLYFKSTHIFDQEPEIIIHDLVKDEQGFMWFASNEGLLLSDGDGFSRISTIDSLSNTVLNTLFYKDGKLYLAWENAMLSVYSIQEEKIIFNYEIPESTISSIVLDKDDNIWLGTHDYGIVYIIDGTQSILDINFGLADNVVNDLVYDNETNSVWAATDRGLSKCEIGTNIKISNYTSKDGLADNLITCIEKDQHSNLWIGSYSGKLALLNSEGEIQKIDIHGTKAPDGIVSIKADGDELWIACENGGLALFNQESKECVSIDKKAFFHEIRALLFIQENQLLVLSNEKDLHIADKNLRFYSAIKNLKLENTSALFTDKDGSILIANTHYISRKNQQDSIEILVDLEKEKIDYVISILIDENATLWFGTFDQGLYRLMDGKLENFNEGNGLINNNVMALYEWKGAIWCGTLGGLCKVEAKDKVHFTTYSKKEGLEAAYIYQLYAIDDKLFIASDGEGLVQFQDGQFTKINGVNSSSVYDIIAYEKETLFLSCEQGRIIKLTKGEREENYSILYLDKPVDLAGMLQVDQNTLLFTWEQGIGLLNITTGFYKLFDSSWGLKTFKNDFLNVLTQDADGAIWIGAQDYIIKVNEQISSEAFLPRSILRSVNLFSTPIDTSLHSFSYEEDHFSFHFNSFWYQDPKNIVYQYRLVGLDSTWLNTKDKLIVYPRLESGKYRFELRSGLRNSIEKSEVVFYNFNITKAYYTTWWFFTLITLLFLTGVYGLIIYRDKRTIKEKKLEYERVLSQFELLKSQINPHFLFNSLNTAYALVAKNEGEAREYILSLSNYLRAILSKNQDHVISLSKELNYAKNYTLLQKKRFGTNLNFDIEIEDEGILESHIPPLTLQILIENAIKHNIISKSNPLTIRIYISGDDMVIENNLQIKKRPDEGTKIGLSNIKSRYQILFEKEISILITEDSFVVKLPIIYHYVESFTDRR